LPRSHGGLDLVEYWHSEDLVTEEAEPIPNELGQAFHEILWNFNAWKPPLPEIEVNINGTYQPMSAVCDLVSNYGDALPVEVHERLLSTLRAEEFGQAPSNEQPMLLCEIAHLIRGDRERLNIRQQEAHLAAECTYKTAAFCLMTLIESQRARYFSRTRPKRY
jgi:hypothetical protein